MQSKVLRWCIDAHLVSRGDTVVCAVSGGADSVAMLHCLQALSDTLGITVEAAHFNHLLRGNESDRDEAFVKSLCASMQLPLHTSRGDVSAYARQNSVSIEQAARELRYAFLQSLQGKIATAHTADDQLETILQNLLRGTGYKGLCGIPTKRDDLIRPMLCITRDEIMQYLHDHNLPHVEDSSNQEPFCRRNRLRAQVIPLLREENPSVASTVLRSSQIWKEEDALLDQMAKRLLADAQSADGWSCHMLQQAPSALQRRAAYHLLSNIHAPKLSTSHIDAVCKLICSSDPSARCDLPNGWQARRQYDALMLSCGECSVTYEPVKLEADTWTPIPALSLRAQYTRTESLTEHDCSQFAFCLKADAVDTQTLCLRARLPHDAVSLAGGTKTLKKLFIDRKIPAVCRTLIPVIADANGVLAICGIGVSAKHQAHLGDQAVIIKIEKEDGKCYDQSF